MAIEKDTSGVTDFALWQERGQRYARIRNISLLGGIRALLGGELGEATEDVTSLFETGRDIMQSWGIESGMESRRGVQLAIGTGLLMRAVQRFHSEIQQQRTGQQNQKGA